MANQRLTDKTELTAPLSGDLFHMVDVSDTSGSTAGTSKKIKSESIITTTAALSLDSTAVSALNTSAATLLSPSGSGFGYVVHGVTIVVTYVSLDNGTNLNLYVGPEGSGTTYYWAQQRTFFRNISTDTTYQLSAASGSVGLGAYSIDNKGVKMWTSASIAGDCTIKVYTTYTKITLR